MSKLIITVILLTITALGSAVGLVWAVIQSDWLWAINYSILFVNTVLFALISVQVTDNQDKGDSSEGDQ
ncbi:MAG: hypothetical protein ACI9SP_000733 [Arenicella sp.]|jgi:hypothetical protein